MRPGGDTRPGRLNGRIVGQQKCNEAGNLRGFAGATIRSSQDGRRSHVKTCRWPNQLTVDIPSPYARHVEQNMLRVVTRVAVVRRHVPRV
jgi:hypothetical protein